MELGVMGFMNAALGFLFLAIVYLSSNYELGWVTPHYRYGQRESASISGKCQPPGNVFFPMGNRSSPSGAALLRYNLRALFPRAPLLSRLTTAFRPARRFG